MKISFKKRIALFNTLAVAITMAIVFIVIYLVVRFSSFRHLDNDIMQAKSEVLKSLYLKKDSIIISNIHNPDEAQ